MTRIYVQFDQSDDENLQALFERVAALLSAHGYEVRSVHLVVEVETAPDVAPNRA